MTNVSSIASKTGGGFFLRCFFPVLPTNTEKQRRKTDIFPRVILNIYI